MFLIRVHEEITFLPEKEKKILFRKVNPIPKPLITTTEILPRI